MNEVLFSYMSRFLIAAIYRGIHILQSVCCLCAELSGFRCATRAREARVSRTARMAYIQSGMLLHGLTSPLLRLCSDIFFFPLLVLLLSKSFVAQKIVLSHPRTAMACIQSGVLLPRPTCPWVKVHLLVPRNSQNKASRKFLRVRRLKQPENAKISKIPTSRNDRANPSWSGSGIASERLYLFECAIGSQFIVFSCMERLKAWSQSLYVQIMVVRFWR